jgi:hypothetical protein
MSFHSRAHTRVRASPHQQSQWIPGLMGRPPARTELQGWRPGLPPSQSLRELLLLVLARGAMEWELVSPASLSSTETGPRYPRIPAHRSTDHSSTLSAAGSQMSWSGWSGLSEWGPSWFATASSAGSSGVFHPEY